MVLRIFNNSDRFVRFLAGITRFWTHWVPNAESEMESVPCLDAECPHCETEERQWQGFAPVLAWQGKDAWLPFVFQMSEGFGDLLEQDLRGQVMEVWRDGKRKSSPLAYSFVDEQWLEALPEPPPAFGILPFLLAIWKIPEITDVYGNRWVRQPKCGRQPSKRGAEPPPWVTAKINGQKLAAEQSKHAADRAEQADLDKAWDALSEESKAVVRQAVLAKHPHLGKHPRLLELQCAKEMAILDQSDHSSTDFHEPSTNGANGQAQPVPPKG